MKKKTIFLIVFFLIIFISGFFFFQRSTTLIGLTRPYTLQAEDVDITFQIHDKYTEKTGCEPTGCTGKSWCVVNSEIIDTQLGCPIEQCYGDGYDDCSHKAYRDKCSYGGVCTSPDTCYFQAGRWQGTCCTKKCTWKVDYDIGKSGGANFDDVDNCAWIVTVKDKQGKVLKKYDQVEKYGEEWVELNKPLYTRETMNDVVKGTNLYYLSDDYGAVGSGSKTCRAVNFIVEDDRFRYNFCMGNDGRDEPVCKDVLTKTCKQTCYQGTRLDIDKCECVEYTEPEPVIEEEQEEEVEEEIVEEVEEEETQETEQEDTTEPIDDKNPVNPFIIIVPFFVMLLIIIILRSRK